MTARRILAFILVTSAVAVAGIVAVSALVGPQAQGGVIAAWGTAFLVLPPMIGAAIAVLLPLPPGTKLRKPLLIGWLVVTMAFIFGSLIVLGVEGVVCCLMATPIVGVTYAGGAIVGWYARPGLDFGRTTLRLPAFLAALAGIVVLSARVERAGGGVVRTEAISTSIAIPAPADAVWSTLQSVDHLEGPRPFLLRIGLPVPKSCWLERPEVGARRVCTFDRGRIEERVTAWDPPRRLDLVITGSSVPGRHWLGYVSATYELSPRADGGTDLVRTTTITSVLRPAWYWRPLERWGVESEHRYLLEYVRSRFPRS